MHVCLDVGYRGKEGIAACVVFDHWESPIARRTLVEVTSPIRDYVPGRFFERELPCLLAVLDRLDCVPETIVIDGHARLSDNGKPGLGQHLHKALNQEPNVIGVAKSSFRGLNNACEVSRGQSTRPLYVTAVGIAESRAADLIRSMHGKHRVPTLLRLADQLTKPKQL